MKNVFKDFLFFNQRDKNAIILLLVLIAIAGIYSIYINSLSKLDPSQFILQQQIEKEFKTYEENLESKEIVSIYNNEDIDATETEISATETKKQSKSKKTKLTEGQVVDLNRANVETLVRIPGIGKTLALRIVEYRSEIGHFETIEEIIKIKGITNNKLIQILPYLVLTDKTTK